MVTTGAVRRAKLQSGHHQQTNIQSERTAKMCVYLPTLLLLKWHSFIHLFTLYYQYGMYISPVIDFNKYIDIHKCCRIEGSLCVITVWSIVDW